MIRSKYEIYINGELSDNLEGLEVPLTYQLFDLLASMQLMSNYSKELVFPITDINMRLLGHPDLIESADITPKTKINVKIIKDGIELVKGGDYIIDSITDVVTGHLFFGSYDFYYNLENKTLRDIDCSELDHDWNWDAIRPHIETPALLPLVYAPIEWGEYISQWIDPDTELEYAGDYITGIGDICTMYPSIKASYLLEKIIEEAGYYGVNFDPSDFPAPYNNMYIPLTSLTPNALTQWQASQGYAIANAPFSNWDFMIYVTEAGESVPEGYQAILFDTINLNYFNQVKTLNENIGYPYPDIDYPYTAIRIGCNGVYGLVAHIILSDINMPVGGQSRYRVAICSSREPNYSIYDPTYGVNGSAADNFDELSSSETINIDASVDEVEVDVFLNAELTPGTLLFVMLFQEHYEEGYYVIPSVQPGSYFRFTNVKLTTTGFGYNIPIAINLPNIKQGDFVKSILGFFGGMVISSMYTKDISQKQIKDIFQKMTSSVDWSNKLDLTDQPEIIHNPEDLAKRNHFRYADPDDKTFIPTVMPNPDDGLWNAYEDWFDIVNGELLEDEKIFFQSIFSPSRMVERIANDLWVPQIKMMNKVYQELEAPSPRIILIDLYSTSFSRRYRDDITTFPLSEEFAYLGGVHDELRAYFLFDDNGFYESLSGGKDMSWSVFKADHYTELIYMYNHFKMIIANINLEERDLINFSHFVAVWLQKYSSYFIVNKIGDYVDGLTPVELIKLY